MVFDPNSASAPGSGIFGLPYKESDAALVYIPVPWEATVSYGLGTAQAPRAILSASRQVDLFDFDVEKPYAAGLFLRPADPRIKALNARACAAARKKSLKTANDLGGELNAIVRHQTQGVLAAGKIPAIIGGDHSAPYGAFAAAAEAFGSLGVLHFDAHHDMRESYEGFRWSHASIMRNALDGIPGISKLVQVGIRDFCEQERAYALSQKKRVAVFYDQQTARRKFMGESWDIIAKDATAALPKTVWVSFDIDGLDPALCPHTGTPVPGGLSFTEAEHILRRLVESGRTIAGFDLVEVSPSGRDEWDANVGARLLYKLSAWALASRGLAKIR